MLQQDKNSKILQSNTGLLTTPASNSSYREHARAGQIIRIQPLQQAGATIAHNFQIPIYWAKKIYISLHIVLLVKAVPGRACQMPIFVLVFR
jgi:hypothetical protein